MDVQGCGKKKNLCLKFFGTTNQWGDMATHTTCQLILNKTNLNNRLKLLTTN